MSFHSLGSFIKELDSRGELLRVDTPVSPILEIAAIADRESKSSARGRSAVAGTFDPGHEDRGGRALLFENVEGSDFPVAINLWGSYHRMELALGSDFESIAARIASLTKPTPPRGLGELLAKAREFLPLLRIPPRTVRRHALCQEVVKLTSEGQVDLTRLGMIKAWPLDGDPEAVGYPMTAEQAGTAKGQGRYITLAGMHTIHADDAGKAKPGSHNIGMYRSQLIDETHLAMHWHVHHDGANHWRSWKKLGKPMPIAICLGGESVLPYAATAPLPPGISELLMAGFLMGRGIPMVEARTVPIRVPANSEIVIEGWVSTECGPIGWEPSNGEPLGPGAVFEGPFGDHTGFYSLPDRYPIVEVTAITHRRDAVYPTTIVGAPPMEDYYLGKATERVFLPLLKTIVHDIEDYHLPMFGCFHNCAAIQISKAYPMQGRRVMHSVWGAGQMAWTKMIMVVDEDVDIHDERAMFEAVLTRCDFRWDLQLTEGPLDILDQAAPELGAGGKIGFDATRKLEGDRTRTRSLDMPRIDTTEERRAAEARIAEIKDLRWSMPEWGAGRLTVAAVPGPCGTDAVHRMIESIWERVGVESSAADLLLIVDESVRLDAFDDVLFELTACADPVRDLVRDDTTEGRRIAFDATSKSEGDHSSGSRVRRYATQQSMPDEIMDKIREIGA